MCSPSLGPCSLGPGEFYESIAPIADEMSINLAKLFERQFAGDKDNLALRAGPRHLRRKEFRAYRK
jgi:hypothetical protein